MKLNFGTKLSYGIGGFADNAMYTVISTFMLFFLTSVAGVQPAAAGTIIALGTVWEAICGPITGFISDSTVSRFGKRKPFLLAAAFPVALVTSLLFLTIHASATVKIIYYLVMMLMFWQSFALFFVPYLAWGSDLTDDYNERTILRSYAYVFNMVGMSIGMVMPTILVDFLMNLGKSKETSWLAVGIMVGVMSGLSLFICAITIKKTDVPDFVKPEHKERILTMENISKMFKEYFLIIKLRPIKFIMGASLLFLVANMIFSSDRVYFFTYNLHMTAGEISIAMLVVTISGIAFAPVVAKVCKRIDKTKCFSYGIALTGFLMIISRFVGVGTFFDVCIVCLIFAVGDTCYWQLMPSMIYDVCEAEQLVSGEKHSGQVISLQAFSESIAAALGSQILGISLQLAGFSKSASLQPASALSWISTSFTFIPGIIMIAVALIVMKYPIDKDAFERIKRALADRNKGVEVDMTEFNDIFGDKDKRNR